MEQSADLSNFVGIHFMSARVDSAATADGWCMTPVPISSIPRRREVCALETLTGCSMARFSEASLAVPESLLILVGTLCHIAFTLTPDRLPAHRLFSHPDSIHCPNVL